MCANKYFSKPAIRIFFLFLSLTAFVAGCNPADTDDIQDQLEIRKLTNSLIGIKDAAYIGDGGKIIYIEDINGTSNSINIIDADGLNQTRIVTGKILSNLCVSRDSKSILFKETTTSSSGSSVKLFMYNIETTVQTDITDSITTGINYSDLTPTGISPDNNNIVFDVTSNSGGFFSNTVYVYNFPDDSSFAVTPGMDLFSGGFSPDGYKILLVGFAGGSNAGIFTIGTDGTQFTTLQSGLEIVRVTGYSPQGYRIMFSASVTDSLSGNEYEQIFSMASDGSNKKQLTSSAYDNSPAAFSNSGGQILYSSNRDSSRAGNTNIYMSESDGNFERLLINYRGRDIALEFSPTNNQIMFLSDDSGVINLYVKNNLKPIPE